MEELLTKYNLTENELKMILHWFGSETMSGALRFMHKSPSHFYWEESEENEFPTYELWELSCKMNFNLEEAE